MKLNYPTAFELVCRGLEDRGFFRKDFLREPESLQEIEALALEFSENPPRKPYGIALLQEIFLSGWHCGGPDGAF